MLDWTVLRYLYDDDHWTRRILLIKECAELFRVKTYTARYHLEKLVRLGLLRKMNTYPVGYYPVPDLELRDAIETTYFKTFGRRHL